MTTSNQGNKKHILLKNVSSRNIKKVGYEDSTKTLVILFHGSNQYYFYQDVPKGTYLKLLTAPSVGHYFHTKINHKFNFVKQQ